MNFNHLFNRAKNLIVNPQMEWVRIESEHITRKQAMNTYVIPFVILIAICSFIGDSLLSFQQYSLGVIIIKILVKSLLLIGEIYLSFLIINELTTSFGIPRNPDATFKLITYSFTSFFIVSCLVGLFPDMGLIEILAFHSVYLFWLGTTPVLKTSESGKPGFVFVSFLIIVGIYAIVRLIVNTVENGLLYIS